MNDSIQSRNDVLAIPRMPSDPPVAKSWLKFWNSLRELIVLGIALLAARWGIISNEIFACALLTTIGISAALRTGQGINAETIQALLKR